MVRTEARPFHGSAAACQDAAPPLCPSPLYGDALPCKKPFTAPEAESCRFPRTIWMKRVKNKVSDTEGTLTARVGHGFHDRERDFSSAGCYSGVN